MHWRKVMDYRFLSAEELEKEITVTIKSFKQEDVFNPRTQKTELKLAIYFEEAKKGVIVNKTNAQMISKVTGSPHLENWIGKKITIYPAKVKVAGNPTTGIRVKEIKHD